MSTRLSRIVLASNNAGKLREFQQLFQQIGMDIIPQGDLNIPAAIEPHATFIENALEKARHASHASGLPALADDSGICVEALHGAPGIYSARFAGEHSSDLENNLKLISELKEVTNRKAHYLCALVFVRHPQDPEPLIAIGKWFGEVVDQAQGDGGFGYDPYFYLPELGKTAAQLSSAEKNRLGHRGRAMADLIEQLKTVLNN